MLMFAVVPRFHVTSLYRSTRVSGLFPHNESYFSSAILTVIKAQMPDRRRSAHSDSRSGQWAKVGEGRREKTHLAATKCAKPADNTPVSGPRGQSCQETSLALQQPHSPGEASVTLRGLESSLEQQKLTTLSSS